MERPVILSAREQEYLLRVIEAALQVRDLNQFFLWTQGQFQALLPHEFMLCLQFGAHDELAHIECVHGAPLHAAALRLWCDRRHGLALRLAQACRAGASLPAMLPAIERAGGAPLRAFLPELAALGYEHIVVHGTERLAGSASFFILAGLPHKPGTRQAYFFDLLLPYLHLALLRVAAQQGGASLWPAPAGGSAGSAAPIQARALSVREREILHWVREGKSNDDIGQILGISGLTVKNHLQRVYRTLGVNNRTQAVTHAPLGVPERRGAART